MKIQLENKVVETREETINGLTTIYFRVNKNKNWYRSPYSTSYDLISEVSKLKKDELDCLLDLIKEDAR